VLLMMLLLWLVLRPLLCLVSRHQPTLMLALLLVLRALLVVRALSSSLLLLLTLFVLVGAPKRLNEMTFWSVPLLLLLLATTQRDNLLVCPVWREHILS
jgi:hypothetical protein